MKKFNKKNPFKIPKAYFEGFNDRLMNHISKEKSSIPKKDGFGVPENYFDTLHSSVIDEINHDKTKVIPLRSYKKYYYAAASIAAIVVLFYGLNRNAVDALSFDSLAESDLENYFENNTHDLSDSEIAEVIPLDELEITDILTNRFNEENVVDYIDDNIDDFYELNFEDYE